MLHHITKRKSDAKVTPGVIFYADNVFHLYSNTMKLYIVCRRLYEDSDAKSKRQFGEDD